MKKLIQNVFVRSISGILCIAALLGILISSLGIFFLWNFEDQDKWYREGREKLLENYAMYAFDHMKDEGLAGKLENTNVYISIVRKDGELEETVLSTMPAGKKAEFTTEFYEGASCKYSTQLLLSALCATIRSTAFDLAVPVSVNGYLFDASTGLFYYETPIGYFKVTYLEGVTCDGETYDYFLSQKDGKECYYNSFYKIALDTAGYESWDRVKFNGKNMHIGINIDLITETGSIAEKIRDEYYFMDDYELRYVPEEIPEYMVSVAVADVLEKQDLLWEWKWYTDGLFGMKDWVVVSFWSSVTLFIFGAFLLICSTSQDKSALRFYHKIPILVLTVITLLAEGLLVGAEVSLLIYLTETNHTLFFTMENVWLTSLFFAVAICTIGVLWMGNVIARLRTGSFFRYSELYYLTRPLVYLFYAVRNHASLFWKGILLFVPVTALEFLFAIVLWESPVWGIVLLFLFKSVEFPLFLYILIQMKMLQEGSKRLVAGDWSKPIPTAAMLWEFKKHGENINKVGEGIAVAVDEQLKSERFKTELITNVSHDIKTPLTSIINYVDLMKKEEIEDPTLHEYIEVLDRQSARLKKLTDDLVEASKASSGSLKVEQEPCDLGVLLTQVAGEFDEKLDSHNLELVLNHPEEPVMILADGRHLWRVFDNLMNNICKYSLPKSRVYVTLTKEEGQAVIVFKNISKEALNIPSEQLMERFVRGDSSRNTEGSGLGLSIAQSLTELMQGKMKLDIDGDLFKVMLSFTMIE